MHWRMSMGTCNKSDLIVEAAATVFPRLGYHGATVEDILQEAKVARSTFYVYFSGKRDVFMNLCGSLMDEIRKATNAGVERLVVEFSKAGAPPAEKYVLESLSGFLAELFTFVETNRGVTRVFFNDFLVIDDETTGMFRAFQAQLTDEFEKLIEVGIRIGFLRQVSRRRAAEFIVAGLVHTARNISTGTSEYDVSEVSREIVDMQINGLRPVASMAGADI